MPMPYADKINDGLRLKFDGPRRVEAFDFTNPFPFALGWPVVRHSMWAWHDGFTFGKTSYPAAEEAFGGADVIMVPKYPGGPEAFAIMSGLYGEYLNMHFQMKEQSDQWVVLQRR